MTTTLKDAIERLERLAKVTPSETTADAIRTVLATLSTLPAAQTLQGDQVSPPDDMVLVSRSDIMIAWLGIGNASAGEEIWAAGERLFDAAAIRSATENVDA